MKRLIICTLVALVLWLSLGVPPAYAVEQTSVAERTYIVRRGDALTRIAARYGIGVSGARQRGYGLHGTYWHDNFGTPMSHGCVNLSNADAQWLFNWASVGTKVVTHT
jgi:hypothetical protein